MYSIVGERRTYTVCISYTALIVNLVTKRTYSWQKKKKQLKTNKKTKLRNQCLSTSFTALINRYFWQWCSCRSTTVISLNRPLELVCYFPFSNTGHVIILWRIDFFPFIHVHIYAWFKKRTVSWKTNIPSYKLKRFITPRTLGKIGRRLYDLFVITVSA